MDFKKLKEASSLEKLQKAIEEEQNKKGQVGENSDEYWQPSVDKAGNGSAKIRFLPAPPQDGDTGLPWVKWWRYSFQGPGGWYIQNSLTSIDQPDPCQEYNNRLWKTKIKANEEIARKQNRAQTVCCNIEILQDPLHPENDGLVRKFKFGKKIWNKIQAAMEGVYNETTGECEEEPFNPFDFETGADFRIKIKTIDVNGKKFKNYDDSKFLNPAPRSTDQKFLEDLWKKTFSLKELLAPSNFKTYEQLEKELTRVLGFNPNHEANNAKTIVQSPQVKEEVKQPTVESKITSPVNEDEVPWKVSEDDDLSMFKSLIADD